MVVHLAIKPPALRRHVPARGHVTLNLRPHQSSAPSLAGEVPSPIHMEGVAPELVRRVGHIPSLTVLRTNLFGVTSHHDFMRFTFRVERPVESPGIHVSSGSDGFLAGAAFPFPKGLSILFPLPTRALPTCRQSCGSTPDSQLSAELNDTVSSPERCIVDSHGEMIGTSIVCMLFLF